MDIWGKTDIVNKYCASQFCDTCVLNCGGWKMSCVHPDCLHIECCPESDLDRALALIGYVDEPAKGEDNVNHPSHYTDGKIEVIDFIEDKNLGFCLGNAVKYIARAGKKDPTKEVEDLKKAEWYIKRRIRELEGV